jgi:fibronectin-binding autotransporter adhesin
LAYQAGGLTVSGSITFGTSNTTQWRGPIYLNSSREPANGRLTFSGNMNVAAVGADVYVFDPYGYGGEGSCATISGIISGTVGSTGAQLRVAGGGTLRLTGNNTYESDTTIYQGVVEVTTLVNDYGPCSLGSSKVAGDGSGVGYAFINFGSASYGGGIGATLRYIGAATSTNRSMWSYGDATLDASGTGKVFFSDGVKFKVNDTGKVLTLTGSNTDDNQLGNMTADFSNGMALAKTGTGTWYIDWSTYATSWTTRSSATSISQGKLKIRTSPTQLGAFGSGPVTLGGTLHVWNTVSTNSKVVSVSSITTSGSSARIIIGS